MLPKQFQPVMITCSCHLRIDVDEGPLTIDLLSSEDDGRDFHITCMENWTLMYCMKFESVKLFFNRLTRPGWECAKGSS